MGGNFPELEALVVIGCEERKLDSKEDKDREDNTERDRQQNIQNCSTITMRSKSSPVILSNCSHLVLDQSALLKVSFEEGQRGLTSYIKGIFGTNIMYLKLETYLLRFN